MSIEGVKSCPAASVEATKSFRVAKLEDVILCCVVFVESACRVSSMNGVKLCCLVRLEDVILS